MSTPAMIRAPMNSRKPTPTPAILPSRVKPTVLMYGISFISTLLMSVAACIQ
ncbi:hypothetical protein D9M71_741170 [compost metagenome]